MDALHRVHRSGGSLDKRVIDNHLASLLSRTARKANNRLTSELHTVGLSLDAWLVLNMLVTEGARSMGEIARALVLNLPTATKLIDRMVNDNLVYRKPHHQDRRIVEIFPSDAGVMRHQVAQKLVAREQAALKQVVPELDRLMQELVRLKRSLDNAEE